MYIPVDGVRILSSLELCLHEALGQIEDDFLRANPDTSMFAYEIANEMIGRGVLSYEAGMDLEAFLKQHKGDLLRLIRLEKLTSGTVAMSSVVDLVAGFS